MRYAIFLGMAIAAVVLGMPLGHARAERWCAVYSGGDGDAGTNCGFYTLQQCRDTILSGDRCIVDYMYMAQKRYEPAKPRVRHKRVRSR